MRQLILLLLLATASCVASSNSALPLSSSLIAEASELQLDSDPMWHKLLHYETKFHHRIQSSVRTEMFFLSALGSSDPEIEMHATIRAFLTPASNDINQHPRCRFPARYQWLTERLSWPPEKLIPIDACSQLKDWSKVNTLESVSLFFANGFWENPASFFGHVFIRFNADQSKRSNNLLSMSLDYGAIIPENENTLIYITKGVFGGYNAGFSDGNYYQHDFNYGETQLRDLWEYRLLLTPEQIDLLLHHVWELMPQKSTYYFTFRNCGSAIADLIELIFPKMNLYSKKKLWVLPSDVFKNIHDYHNTYSGSGIFHPSRKTRFEENHSNLNARQKKSFHQQVKEPDASGNGTVSLTETEEIQTLNTLLDYYQMISVKSPNSILIKKKKDGTLRKRMKLKAGTFPLHDQKYANQKAPHECPGPSMLRVTQGTSNNRSITQFRYRPLQFDLLGLECGRPKNANLSLFDITGELKNGSIDLKNIDLLKIVSINSSNTRLPGDSTISWKLNLSYGTNEFLCVTCKQLRGRAGVGKAISFKNDITLYSFLEAQLQNNSREYSPFSLVPSAGILYNLTTKTKIHSTVEMEANEFKQNFVYLLEARHQLSTRVDIRFRYEKLISSNYTAGLSYYW